MESGGLDRSEGAVTVSPVKIRDPFVLPVHEERLYYLYGTTGYGFDCYTSRDLISWSDPRPVFRPGPDFWANKDFWAPEVYRFRGRYFMFASCKADGVCRGTQVFVADHPAGPFTPWSDGPVTPRNWECLDGTLYVDGSGMPWMIFCHEWLQVGDGEICAIPLKDDLAASAGEPSLLFRASDALWPVGKEKVTDGPYAYRSEKGELCLLWSSFSRSGYSTAIARSQTGELVDPWIHDREPVYANDGGHAMIFRDWGGRAMMSLHSPNSHARAIFFPFSDAEPADSVH